MAMEQSKKIGCPSHQSPVFPSYRFEADVHITVDSTCSWIILEFPQKISTNQGLCLLLPLCPDS
jgi:hypothetical protein